MAEVQQTATTAKNPYAPNPYRSKFKATIAEMRRKKEDPNFIRYVMDQEGYDVSLVDQELANLQSYDSGEPIQPAKVDANALPGDKLDQTQLTATQSTALLYGQRMYQSGKILDALDEGIANKDFLGSVKQRIDESNVGGTVTGQFVGEEFKKFDQAKRDFINASLRRESGAVISPQEFENADKQYFPVPGDSKDVLAQKKANREVQAKGFLKSAGVTDAEINFNSQEATAQPTQSSGQIDQAKAWLQANPNDPRVEKVKAKIAQMEGSTTQTTQQPATSQDQQGQSGQPGFLSTLGSEIASVAGSAKDRLGSAMTDVTAQAQQGNAPSLFGRAGLRAAGVIGGTINDAFGAMLKVGFSALPDAQQKALKDTANTAINSETGKAAISALQAGTEKWNQFKDANPVVAKDIEDAANVFAAIPAAKGIAGVKNLASDAKTLLGRTKDAAVGAVRGQEQYVTKATDNAFRAIKPTLTVGRDKMAARSVVSTAMQEVANQGIVPTNLRTFAEGLTQTKQAVWKKIEASIGGGKNLQVDVQSIADELMKMAQSSTLSMADRTAATKIGQMAQNLVSNGGKISVPDAELLKQYLNGELKGAFGKFNMSAAEVNAKKMITAKIGEQLDSLLSSVPGEFSSLKKTYGALRQTEEDVMKRLITFERQNPQGLIESFGKISGIGNVLKGVVTANPGEILKGAAEFTMGKIQQAANNSDLLIKKSFELLNKGKGSFEPRSSILKKLMSGSAGLSIQDITPRGAEARRKLAELIKKMGEAKTDSIRNRYGKAIQNLINSENAIKKP